MNGKVLVIEDEKELGELVQIYLEKEGIKTDICLSAEEGLSLLKLRPHENRENEKDPGLPDTCYDLIILDINLPGMDGFEFLQILRKKAETPVLILSAREADEDIVLGLGLGADEFVSKPFAPKVLAARVRAILRRAKIMPSRGNKIYFGPYELDPEGYSLLKEGKRIILSSKEVEVLAFLARNAGKAFSPDEIYSNVWGREYGDIASVGVYVQRLRKKIEIDCSVPEYIITIRGRGYLFNAARIRNEP